MVSLLEELERREVAIRERVAELRVQVSELSDQLEAFEEMLSQVQIARRVVREVLDDTAADEQAVREQAGVREAEAVSPIGVTTVPQWARGRELSVLPSANLR
jgi:septation ring formation regulator EzrA